MRNRLRNELKIDIKTITSNRRQDCLPVVKVNMRHN